MIYAIALHKTEYLTVTVLIIADLLFGITTAKKQKEKS